MNKNYHASAFDPVSSTVDQKKGKLDAPQD